MLDSGEALATKVSTVSQQRGTQSKHERPDQQPPSERPRRPGSIRIASLAGVPIYVNVSWFLVALLIAYLFTPIVERQVPGLGVFTYVAAFAFAVLLYGSVLIHEISHVLVAKAFGLPVRGITLQFLGGVSEIEQEPDSAWREFAVAVVGPLTSLAIGGLAVAAVFTIDGPALVNLLIAQLAIANLLVGVFNLLPGLPLDGGRMLRAGVWALTKRPHTATTVSAWAGRVVAVVVVAIPWLLFSGDSATPSLVHILWSVVIAVFLWVGSTQALMASRVRRKLPALRARELARRALAVPFELPLSEAVRRARDAVANALVIIDPDRRPVGIVKESAVAATPEHRRPWISVGDVSRRLESGLVLSAELSGEELVRAMSGTPASEYLVVEASGEVYGVLSASDVDAAFARA